MANLKQYPLLPLRDTVVFPHNVASLFVGREKSMEAVRQAMDQNRQIVLVAQRESEVVLVEAKDLFEIGVLAEILQLLKMPDGTYKVLIEAIKRVVVREFIDHPSFQEVVVEPVEDILRQEEKALVQQGVEELIQLLENYNQTKREFHPDFLVELRGKKDPSVFVDSIAHSLKLPHEQKQMILETLNIAERMEKVRFALERQLEIAELENSIQNRVREQMDKMQRQYYLHEQLRIIKEELGEGDYSELENFRRRFEQEGVPAEVRQKALNELKRLEKTPPLSAEYTILRNYIEFLASLPWGVYSKDKIDLRLARQTLEQSHYGLEKVKERMLEFLAVRRLNPQGGNSVLCLVGPPGVGKTSLARALAECIGRKFIRISLGGVRDEAEIRGHRRTYVGALPGRLASALAQAKTMNPLILLDELDKLSHDFRGNPAAALLEALDPEQNKEFTDHYLEIGLDLSQVLFVATANSTDDIIYPLLDRLEIIRLSSYTENEKIQIARSFLLPRQVRDTGIHDVEIRYNEKSLAYIIRHYTREAGVRQLERQLAKFCRKIALEYVANPYSQKVVVMNKETIRRYLGREEYDSLPGENKPVVGKAWGLAYTQTGGEVLPVEVAISPGEGDLILTGNLGQVMKESANTALGYVRSLSLHFGLSEDFFKKHDIYLHVAEGATPKDGPSAGIALATALISALLQKAIRHDVAMTGEITLRGIILPVGGIKEKILAAVRYGITQIICPKGNKKDVEELSEEIKEKIRVVFVENIREAFPYVFEGSLNLPLNLPMRVWASGENRREPN
ncbi:MAG: endopeptidase La [Leptospiraceae bacterium]|nr:endopeptidase La [Leptospiraceae bacterium]MDW8306714.1 endopeptidase La [Leptospiraceae bacterium]